VRADWGGGGGDGEGGRGERLRRLAGDAGLIAGLVGGKEAAVVSDIHVLTVEGVYGAAKPPLAVAVEPDGLADFDE